MHERTQELLDLLADGGFAAHKISVRAAEYILRDNRGPHTADIGIVLQANVAECLWGINFKLERIARALEEANSPDTCDGDGDGYDGPTISQRLGTRVDSDPDDG